MSINLKLPIIAVLCLKFIAKVYQNIKLSSFTGGGGYSGRAALDFLYDVIADKKVYFIDDDPEKQDKKLYRGVYCYGPEKMFGCDSGSSIILITSSWHANNIFEKIYRKPGAVKSEFMTKGKLGNTIVDKYFIELLCPTLGSGNLILQNPEYKDKLMNIFDLLEDDVSCEIFYRRLLYISGVIPAMAGFSSYPQYFPPEIISRMTKDEVFVDCGAYDGDTAIEFKKQSKDVFKKIYAFEMDEDNFKKLQAFSTSDKRICPINKGVGNVSGKLRYRKDGTASAYAMWDVNLFETHLAEIVKVDDMVASGEISEKVTFVKMDIEGAELDALKGMENILRRDKPKLAVCIYHKASDLIEIPNFIKNIVPEYRFMIRHHSENIGETVLYAFT